MALLGVRRRTPARPLTSLSTVTFFIFFPTFPACTYTCINPKRRSSIRVCRYSIPRTMPDQPDWPLHPPHPSLREALAHLPLTPPLLWSTPPTYFDSDFFSLSFLCLRLGVFACRLDVVLDLDSKFLELRLRMRGESFELPDCHRPGSCGRLSKRVRGAAISKQKRK